MPPALRTPTSRSCSVASALDVVGEKWSLLVVRDLFLGARRFSDLAARTGAPRDILTARLRRLEELGVIERQAYSEHPPRFDYRLTTSGKDLWPVIATLKAWGDKHVQGRYLPPLQEHTCGELFRPVIHCAACGDRIERGSLHRRDAP